MSNFQKIAIGLLGLTHPEMFIPKSWTSQKSTPRIEFSCDHRSTESVRPRGGEVARVLRAFRLMLSALAIGSRTVPLADNSQLSRDLGARARRLYGAHED
jgi:hypothetical protein